MTLRNEATALFAGPSGVSNAAAGLPFPPPSREDPRHA